MTDDEIIINRQNFQSLGLMWLFLLQLLFKFLNQI